MGFETIPLQCIDKGLYQCLKIPYGIWNWEGVKTGWAQLKFEDSLWDLKQIRRLKPGESFISLKIPYGIWNINLKLLMIGCDGLFEDSLWDLKPRQCSTFG